MFIYSSYSNFGAERPEKLVNMLVNEGIEAVCYIDECGMGIQSFYRTCEKRKIKASIAVPFESFIENVEQKCKGYLVTAVYESYENILSFVEENNQKFIPYITSEEIELLAKQNVYWLIQNGDYCYEYSFHTKIKVTPVAYDTLYTKERIWKEKGVTVGISLEDNFYSPETVIFLEGISKEPHIFLEKYKQNHHYMDLASIREKKKQLM